MHFGWQIKEVFPISLASGVCRQAMRSDFPPKGEPQLHIYDPPPPRRDEGHPLFPWKAKAGVISTWGYNVDTTGVQN